MIKMGAKKGVLGLVFLAGIFFLSSYGSAACITDENCDSGQVCCNGTCLRPACKSKADCQYGQICINSGTCQAECIFGCVTSFDCLPAQRCCNERCVLPACDEDSDCDDSEEATVDKCLNPGKCEAECINRENGDYGNGRFTEPPITRFKRRIELGETQTITMATVENEPIEHFNVLLTYPDGTTVMLTTSSGAVTLPLEQPGDYLAIVQANDYQTELYFQAYAPRRILPPIPKPQKKIIKGIFGQDTAEFPDYLIIWLLGIAVISGLIVVLTRVKPPWFRIFLGVTYTALPFVVNYYFKVLLFALAIMAVETTILLVLLVRQIKGEKAAKEEKERLKKGPKLWKKEQDISKEKPVEDKWDQFFKKMGEKRGR